MKNFRKNNNGFSLVELIITVVLVFILISVGYLVISAGNDNFDKGTAKAHMQQNARLLDEFIQGSMRNSTNIILTSVEAEKLDNQLTLVDSVIVSNGVNLTAAVIDDLQIKVDESGDRPILEYIIYTLYKEETFEMRGSIVLNNLPSDYFGGAYSTFTSIGSSSLTYNAEVTIPEAKSITVQPNFIIRGRTYEYDLPEVFYVYLVNEIFRDTIDAIDISLGGGMGLMRVKSVEWTNETLIAVSLYDGPVTDAVGTGTITVHSEGLMGDQDLTVSVNIIDPDISYIEIAGSNDILIPAEGSTSSTYTFKAYDSEDREITNESAIWTYTPESADDGITMNSSTGTLTVTSLASPTTITVHAQSVREPLEVDEFTVNLVAYQESLENLMGQLFLQYDSGYTSTMRPTFLICGNIEGVTFYFVEVSGENFSIEGEDDEKVLISGNNKNISGGVKVVGHRNGEYWIKEFAVYVPKYFNNQASAPIVITPGDIYQISPPS
ncbi:MAG: prepilin-type N-terminal cleavage/methylation domain-containing protein [Clostridia bacterium]|nr:prepilin-type N-terminal cleavage/methylation domain-containing protein [Clostridia bacterium]